ncbi:MAG TPA: KH domain-containing protein [Candidatus Methanoculleus thermohydrogenotrophicum]|jgi:ribosomal RNA assembly protein|nr:KH domain-containing protein [Candidatus Methanoculleus thermohydrogenotrophicum]NLM81774.1 RNA-processing protein [Candidatus Methanoculleus thermohydrogenotrophicum]HOB17745.1 KH domain-containing protein [Candidatus Methanoculleus thermohydrogenotrophicum]HPZ37896.1 KH domain-containing protein [Candidatus Methanoculleus thermohydrogenotrophicum]HQC90737.1 KH domain-containing protein [Candidatus Methanoculleus thermohydrogenotrophicum]
MARQEIKVSTARIGVIIGKKGATKREIEEKTGVSLRIDSEEGTVVIEGDDPVAVMTATSIIQAINRGFSPERAFRLLEDEDMMLDVIDLTDLSGTTRHLERLRGRIIGKAGTSRAQIEDMTNTQISVHGKTVAIIGLPDQNETARKAVEMLIQGVPHENVYAFLDRKRKEAKHEMLEYYS